MKAPLLRARQTGQTILPRAKQAILTILSGAKRVILPAILTILSGAQRVILPAILAALWLGASARAQSPATTQTAAQPLPSGISRNWWSAVQKSIRDSEYDVTPSAGNRQNSESKAPAIIPHASWQAANRAQNLRTYFTEKGPRVARRTETEPSWVWGLELVGFGIADCGSRTGDAAMDASVSPALGKASKPCPPVVETKREGNRIEFRRQGGLVEWYVNDPKGLEQGFTISEPQRHGGTEAQTRAEPRTQTEPQRYGDSENGCVLSVPLCLGGEIRDEMCLELAVRGNLRPSMAPDSKTIEFLTAGGVGVMRYGGVKAVDAAGRQLPARMELIEKEKEKSRQDLQDEQDLEKASRSAIRNPQPEIGNPQSPICNPAIIQAEACTPNFFRNPQSAIRNPQSAIALLRLVVDATDAAYPITIDPLASSAAWTAESDQADARFGCSVSTAGDVNGDGYDDVIVGAYLYDNGETDEGRVFVYHGAASGLSSTPAWTAESNQAGANLGYSVSTAGDVNGDGYDDVIIGAPYYDNGETDEGRAFVWYGSASGLGADGIPGNADWTAESDQADAGFGFSVSTAGDVNGDNYDDVIVGALWYDNGETDEGRVFVYHGSASGLSLTPSWTTESDQVSPGFGCSVSTAGDVNGDGYSDVIVGAYGYSNGEINEGRAFVYHGSAAGLSATPAWTAESDQAVANFGRSVSTAGDVNGDGYSDVIVGAWYYDNGETDEGRAFVYHGSASGLSLTPSWTAESDQVGARFGSSVSAAGDVNGDGYDDVIVGAERYDNGETDEGRAFVYHGSVSGLSLTPTWSAESDQAGAEFGYSVSTAGDVNGDGYSDIIVGSPYYDNGETDEGRAFVYCGAASGLSNTPSWTAESDQAGALFGYSVSTAGDVNGDGYDDVIVGALLYDNGETDEGRAFVYHGSASGLSPTPAWTAESDQAYAYFGYSVSTAGDVNGDGYDDVVVGAVLYDNGETDEGRAFVYHGSASGLSLTPAWTAESDQAGAYFGFVSTAGDVNGDGYDDVIVGASYYDNGEAYEGRAFVYHGSAKGLSREPAWTAEGDQADAEFGYSVSTAGDVNGDGYDDVIAGAYLYDNGETDEGRAFVYHGSGAGLSATPAWTAESNQAGACLGFSAATAGDVNGDGYSDVIVGAYKYDNGESDEGRAFVYHGSASGLSSTAAWTAESNQANAWFGSCVSMAGDVNGDGYDDVIVGARNYDNGETVEGRAFVYYGSASGLSTSPAWTAEGDQWAVYFGYSVSTAGDVNGDGCGDVIVGARGYDNGETDEGRAFVYLGGPAPPRIQSVVYNDLDDDGAVEAGETLTLVMSRAVTINAAQITPTDFYLCVQGDSLGGAGFGAAVSAQNARHLVLTLGANPVLTLAGAADPKVTATGSPSGLDFSNTLAPGDVHSLDGVDAVAGGRPGVNDSAVDLFFACVAKTTSIAASSGGTATVSNSPDAAYTRHALAIPAGALTQNVSVTMRPPQVNLGVLNAVQIDVTVAGGGSAGKKVRSAGFSPLQKDGVELNGLDPSLRTGEDGLKPALRTDGLKPALQTDGLKPALQTPLSALQTPTPALRTSSDPAFSQPVTLTLEYKHSDYDTAAGDVEASMRIHQLVLNPSSAYEWKPVPVTRQNHPVNNTVSVQLETLNPCGDIGEIRVFAVLPGWTIEPIKAHVRPDLGGGGGSAVILPRPMPGGTAALLPGANGDYRLHRIEIPNYTLTTETDPDRITIDIAPPALLHRLSPSGTSFPASSSALFVVTARNAAGDPVAFISPVNLRVQFMDGTQNAYGDLVSLQGLSGPAPYMRVARDQCAGPGADFALLGGVSQTVDLTSRTVEAFGVVNLTDSSGEGVWGAVIDPSLVPPTPPPPAPSLPRAVTAELDAIRWAWQDNSTTETGFRIYCGPGATAPIFSCFTTAADVTSWTATDLAINTQYAFQVSAFSTVGGKSPRSDTATTWTLAATPTAPAVTGATSTTLNVAIGPGDTNPPGAEYAIYCASAATWVQADGSLDAVKAWKTAIAWSTVTVTGLTPDTLYSFRVEARNGAGVETALGPAADERTLKSSTPPTLPEAAARDRWVLYD